MYGYPAIWPCLSCNLVFPLLLLHHAHLSGATLKCSSSALWGSSCTHTSHVLDPAIWGSSLGRAVWGGSFGSPLIPLLLEAVVVGASALSGWHNSLSFPIERRGSLSG